MTDQSFSIPLTYVQLSGTRDVRAQAYNAFPTDEAFCILNKQLGVYAPGLYALMGNKWKMVLPLSQVDNYVVNGGVVTVYAPGTAGTNLSGQVYHNGALVQVTEFTPDSYGFWATFINGAIRVTVGAQASFDTSSFTAQGSAGMTQVFGPGSQDDAWISVDLPSQFTFAGSSCSRVAISSNSYVVFSDEGGNYDYIPDYNPGQPSVFVADIGRAAICIDGADNSYQNVWTEVTGNQLRIRWEGTDSTSGTPGDSNMIWEMLIDCNVPNVVQLCIVTNARNGDGTTTVTDGVTPLGSFSVAPGSVQITASNVVLAGSALKFANPNTTVVQNTDGILEVNIGEQQRNWNTPNDTMWSIVDYSGGVSVTNIRPIVDFSTTSTLVQAGGPNVIVLQADPAIVDIFNNSPEVRKIRMNNVDYFIDSYSFGDGIISVVVTAALTYTAGDTATLYFQDWNQDVQPVVWFDVANTAQGSQNFRGGVIEYHAYCQNGGTVIGTIMIANDSSPAASHNEVLSGNTGVLETYSFWDQYGNGTELYFAIGQVNVSDTVWIQWTSRLFFGPETWD